MNHQVYVNNARSITLCILLLLIFSTEFNSPGTIEGTAELRYEGTGRGLSVL